MGPDDEKKQEKTADSLELDDLEADGEHLDKVRGGDKSEPGCESTSKACVA